MHVINQEQCTFCGGCSAVCPVLAIVMHDHASRVTESCIDCGVCEVFCPVSAVSPGIPSDKAVTHET